MKNYLYLLLFASCLTSCVKEDVPPCPDQYNVQLFVKDKNYTNQPAVNQDLPFQQYIGGIYYVLHNVETGANIYSNQYIVIDGNDIEYPLHFNDIPNGRYLLAVWGNLPSTGVINVMELSLHANQQELTDMYLGADTLIFTTAPQTARIGMERTKGKLVIECQNLPDTITKVDIQVTNLLQNLNSDFIYSVVTQVTKSFPVTASVNPTLETFLAPTLFGNTSTVTLSLFGSNSSTPIFAPATFDITIQRNEVTTMQVNYNDIEKAWEVWIQIDGNWTMVYHLVLTNS